jgi:H/ACA ribonucleoprotein complex subunit 3
MDVYIRQKKVKLQPQQLIGQGGEAEVYRLLPDTAVKLFKPPSHPDYAASPQAQQAAEVRLALHQQKLRQFPGNLPARVVAPADLVCDRSGQKILGYTMPLLSGAEPLLRYGERSFRQALATQTVVEIFKDLHDTLTQLHQAQVIVGDFNDLNVLIRETSAHLIDADSFQFGAFVCEMFTARFVDPLHCDPDAAQLLPQRPPTPESDWYAFTVMLMQCLLFVEPYGGLYQPKNSQQRLPPSARPLHRITVFHPEVRYPKPALPYRHLPDDLLDHFQRVFEQDWRGIFPRHLLKELHWTTCSTCGREHARIACPQCAQSQITPIVVQEQVTVTPVFATSGIVLDVAQVEGRLRWVYWEAGAFKREDGSTWLKGDLRPKLRWRLQGRQTGVGCADQWITLSSDQAPQRQSADSYGGVTQFDVNDDHSYWLDQGFLWRSGQLGPVVMGEVLAGQTQFWVGPEFGFGFYRAGSLNCAFVFDARRPGLNDRVRLPPWAGQLIQANCAFSRRFCWLFVTTQYQGLRHYHCAVISANGEVVARDARDQHQSHWLTQLGQSLTADRCPYCAVDDFLLAATDDGIVRIQLGAGRPDQLARTKVFAETEPLVDASCRLLAGPQGLWVIRDQQIQGLQLQ